MSDVIVGLSVMVCIWAVLAFASGFVRETRRQIAARRREHERRRDALQFQVERIEDKTGGNVTLKGDWEGRLHE